MLTPLPRLAPRNRLQTDVAAKEAHAKELEGQLREAQLKMTSLEQKLRQGEHKLAQQVSTVTGTGTGTVHSLVQSRRRIPGSLSGGWAALGSWDLKPLLNSAKPLINSAKSMLNSAKPLLNSAKPHA
eukprot:1136805-Prorocentrum_minimum.AAC.1